MERDRAVQPLPRRTSSLLRSSILLPSFPSIVSELVYNSLDAGATAIDVTVDLAIWSITCKDNGTGIPSRGLSRIDRSSTNKLSRDVRGYGFRGEALESMQDLGLVQIISKPTGLQETYELVKRDGRTLQFGRSRTDRTEAGTTVSVRDVFYKYPVRRKSLATVSAQLGTLTHVRTQLSILSLIHPHVSFQLVDTSSQEPKKLLSVSKSTQGVLGRWRQIWGRAGIERVWQFERSIDAGYTAKGFISESASHSRLNQYIFVNRQLVPSSSSSLHRSLNQTFAASSFSRHSSSLFTLRHAAIPASRSPSPADAHLQQPTRNTPKKTVEKYPIFFCQVESNVSFSPPDAPTGLQDYDWKYIGPREEDCIATLLQAIVKEFLIEKGFLAESSSSKASGSGISKGQKRLRSDDSPSARYKRRPESDACLFRQSCSRGGSERSHIVDEADNPTDSNQHPVSVDDYHNRLKVEHPTIANFARQDGPLHQQPQQELIVYPDSSCPSRHTCASISPDPSLHWTDARTSQTFEIDRRTGNSWRYDPARRRSRSEEAELGAGGETDVSARPEEIQSGENEQHRSREGMVDRRALRRNSRVSLAAAGSASVAECQANDTPLWLKNVLATWENPIFPASKPSHTAQIPSLERADAKATSPYITQSARRPPAFGSFPSTKSTLDNRAKVNRARSSSSAQLTHRRISQISKFFSSTSSQSVTSSASFESVSSSIGAIVGGQTFSRESLKEAKFIAQIDDKYLLVKLPSAAPATSQGRPSQSRTLGVMRSTTLVMFDQHAVSERIRVEKYLLEICGDPPVEVLMLAEGGCGDDQKQRIGVIVSREEFRELRHWRTSFNRWGFQFDLASSCVEPEGHKVSGSDKDYVQVWVETVPKVVGQRLIQDSKVLQEVVRGYLAQLRENIRSPDVSTFSATSEVGNNSWVGQVKDCPLGLLELINSKACRGAIMFNDRLRDAQAQSLIDDLSNTKFPFTCAHGRPSIVPLVNLHGPALSVSSNDESVETESHRQKQSIDWGRLV